MLIKNQYGLPEGLVHAVEQGQHPPNPKRFSVTQLIGPPLIRSLQIDHWDELEADVSEYLWMLLGIGVDTVVTSSDGNTSAQYKMEQKIDGHVVVGRLDVINGDTLADYKCTSVWAFLNGIKPEWEAQLNIYDYLYSLEGEEVEHLKVYAILRDWQTSKAKYDKDYPPIPFQIAEVNKWTHEQQEDYILSRLKDHTQNSYRECTDEEKWRSETTYAVKSKGKKRAERVLPTNIEAIEWMKKNRGDYVEERKGECKRCETYCPVRGVCKYGKSI